MRILITSSGNTLQSKFDMKFGRCEWFCFWDTGSEKVEFLENPAKKNNGSAGIKAAEIAAEHKIVQVVSGSFGPKAKTMLNQLNIQMSVLDVPEMSIKEVLQSFKQ